jgi:hypothetical protein
MIEKAHFMSKKEKKKLKKDVKEGIIPVPAKPPIKTPIGIMSIRRKPVRATAEALGELSKISA